MKEKQLEDLMLVLDEAFHYVKEQSNSYLAQALYEQMLNVNRILTELKEDETIQWFPVGKSEQLEIPPLSYTNEDDVPPSANSVLCPFCSFEYNHIVTTMKVISRSHIDGLVNEIILNEEYRIPVDSTYSFLTEANHHILFSCENGHYHIESYDEHEGVVLKNTNAVMIELTLYLNAAYELSNDLERSLDVELLQHIKDFFIIYKQNFN